MITPDQFAAAEKMTAEELWLCLDGQAQAVLQAIIELIDNVTPADAHIIYAALFGALCADSAVQGTDSDKVGEPTTFEERLKLFGIHARISYEGSVKHIVDSGAAGRKM